MRNSKKTKSLVLYTIGGVEDPRSVLKITSCVKKF